MRFLVPQIVQVASAFASRPGSKRSPHTLQAECLIRVLNSSLLPKSQLSRLDIFSHYDHDSIESRFASGLCYRLFRILVRPRFVSTGLRVCSGRTGCGHFIGLLQFGFPSFSIASRGAATVLEKRASWKLLLILLMAAASIYIQTTRESTERPLE